MPGTLRGWEYACQTVADILAAGMPAKVAALAARLAVDPALIPAPALVAPEPRNARIELAQYPAIMVQGRSARRPVAADTDSLGQLVVQRPYNLRVYLFVRARGFDAVATLAKRYLLACEEVLFANIQPAPDARIEPLTLTDSLSDPAMVADRDSRDLSAAFCDFDLILEETFPGPPAVTEIMHPPTVTVGALP